ncbi:hypothetical protein U1Q18_005502 [Sarracenia purpurea var. burkii]
MYPSLHFVGDEREHAHLRFFDTSSESMLFALRPVSSQKLTYPSPSDSTFLTAVSSSSLVVVRVGFFPNPSLGSTSIRTRELRDDGRGIAGGWARECATKREKRPSSGYWRMGVFGLLAFGSSPPQGTPLPLFLFVPLTATLGHPPPFTTTSALRRRRLFHPN